MTPLQRQQAAGMARIAATMLPAARQKLDEDLARGGVPSEFRDLVMGRADSATPAADHQSLRHRVDAALEQMPSPEEAEAARERADAIAGLFGQKVTTTPFIGETLTAYRLRLLRPLLQYSPQLKDAKLDQIANFPAALDLCEKTVREDAIATATEMATKAGKLVALRERDTAGRLITKFYGDGGAAWAPFTSGKFGGTCAINRGLLPANIKPPIMGNQ